MNYEHALVGDTLVIRIREERLDTVIAPKLKERLLLHVQDESIRNLLFAVSAVKSVDSSGLGALLFGNRQVALREGRCCIVDAQPKVVSLLKIAKLDRVFLFADGEDEGLTALASGANLEGE